MNETKLPSPKPPSHAKKQRWKPLTWLIIISLIFFPPIGILLAWFKKDWTRRAKIGATVAGIIWFALIIVSGGTETPPTKQSEQKREETPSPTAKRKQPKKFSKLEITEVVYKDKKVKVIGLTDLPDGSELYVQFDVAGRPETATYIGVDTEVKVNNGKFIAMLKPPNRPEFAKGPYVVEVMFTPRNQPASVTKLVGKNGEFLKGDKVQESYGFKIMETHKKVDLNLEIAFYPMVTPKSYPPDSPERALAEFLVSWQRKDWNRMIRFTQKTWCSVQKNPAETLNAWYGFKDLLGAEIKDKSIVSNVFVDIKATFYYAIGSEVQKKTITATLVREVAPYTPSPQGVWGVNPTSTLKEE